MGTIIQSIVRLFISSFGLKRKLSNLFQTLALAIHTIPGLSHFALLLQAIASWLGLVGIANAVGARTIKVDIHTIAAFFSALLLAAKEIPVLMPYTALIQLIATFLATLGTGAVIGENKTK